MSIAKLTILLLLISATFSRDISNFYEDFLKDCSADQIAKLLAGRFSNNCSESKDRQRKHDQNDETFYVFASYFTNNPERNAQCALTRCVEHVVSRHILYAIHTYTYYYNNSGVDVKRVDKYLEFKINSKTVVVRSVNGICEAYNWLYVADDEDGYLTASCLPLSDDPNVLNVNYGSKDRKLNRKVVERYEKAAAKLIGEHESVKLGLENCPNF